MSIRKRPFDEAFQTRTDEGLQDGKFAGSSPRPLLGGMSELQGRHFKRPYQPLSFLDDLQRTIVLLHQLEQKAKEDPLPLVSRAFDILAEQNGEESASLPGCYYGTLRSLLCRLFDNVPDREIAIGAILTAMEKHASSIMVQLEGCQLLQRFVVSSPQELPDATSLSEKNNNTPTTATTTHRQRALRIIFHSMHHHFDHAALQYLGLELIRKLVQKPDECRLVGGTSILWQTLQIHALEPPIQQLGLSLLAWLAEDDACRDHLISAGAVEIILCLMKLHRRNAWIQCNAAAALCWFVHAGGQNGRCELPAHHIPTVLDILELHQDNASTFGNCVCLLCATQLQDDDDNDDNEEEEEDRVLQIIQNGMKTHIGSAQVQEGCLRWLLLRDPTRITVERLKDQLLPRILEGMKHHMQDAHVQTQAIALLTLLMASQQNLRQVVLQAGVVDGVLETFKRNKKERRVQEGVILFMSLLVPSMDEPYVSAFGGGFGLIDFMWATDQAEEE